MKSYSLALTLTYKVLEVKAIHTVNIRAIDEKNKIRKD